MLRDCGEVWARVEELIDAAPSTEALRAHGVHLLAAAVWRSRGRTVPDEVRADERRAAAMAMAAPLLLRRARAAYPGPLLLMKGPEAAARYPDPGTRYFRDLDLLAGDAPAAQRALTAAGFVEVGSPAEYADRQHLCPLAWPGLPLVVELHRVPNRPAWLAPPPAEEILRLAVPSATGVDGLLAPAPAAHALLLAAHGWAHKPLGRLVDLIDLAAVLGPGDRALAAELARAWGWEGIWRVALGAADALIGARDRSRSLSIWARHLEGVRDRSVLEDHLARVAAPACTVSLRRLPSALGANLSRTVGRRGHERWADKLRRSRLAVAHAFMDRSEHERTLP
ncbi:MAG TPA: nucleotidyltransferase family protein [Solirubrobacteraceae bacterium]|jgi:hypothetical protein|nr:nucleotidyltransferase family protein [Solirubrobacteraceae bacterium]